MKYYLEVLKKYATFSGRARRSEYWYFALFNFIAAILISFVDRALGTSIDFESANGAVVMQFGWIYIVYNLFVLIPSLAVLVRRLHDVGKSGAFFFVAFIPLIGFIWLLVLLFKDSDPGDNKYGPNPKGMGNTEIDQIGSYVTR